MRTLLVAAGGGGDALGALLLRRHLLTDPAEPPLIATYAWERLRIDPLPGPRGLDSFQALAPVAGRHVEIVPTTDTQPPGHSSLPRLAASSDARLFLLDPGQGVIGLTAQLDHLADALSIDRLILIDVGGDAIATGTEPGLKSPLADGLSLAAASALDLPGHVVVTGPGADGELTEAEVIDRAERLRGRRVATLDATDVAPIAHILEWHPSESTALTAAAATGIRGSVEIGRGGLPIQLTDRTPAVWSLDLDQAADASSLARALATTRSLEAAHVIADDVSTSELTYERRKAEQATRPQPAPHQRDVLSVITDTARMLRADGVQYVTTRRLAEALLAEGLTDSSLETVLATIHGARRGALWSLTALADQVPGKAHHRRP